MLRSVLPFTTRVFGRAVIMPNLNPPVILTADAIVYRDSITSIVPERCGFIPLMTAYLTDDTDPEDLQLGFETGVFTAAKLYPAGATTNSENGVTDISKISAVLSSMAAMGMPLLVHGEVTDSAIDIFDRETVFIERVLKPMLGTFPDLRIVFEHITTSEGVAFVRTAGPSVGATITPHHLVINRNAIFAGGIRPHMYCLPIAKREQHRLVLREAATSGEASFFLGTDSAPHPLHEKESDCGCAGIFNAPNAIETYAQVFEEENSLHHFESFASLNGPRFYGLVPNEETITLIRGERIVDPPLQVGRVKIIPFGSEQTLHWKMRTG